MKATIYEDEDKIKINFDRIDVVDKNGKIIKQSEKFPLGTIILQEMKGNGSSYIIFGIGGDAEAQNVFEVLANPDNSTNVEWSWTTFKYTDGSTYNFVSTSQESRGDWTAGELFDYHLNLGNALLQSTHNHPIDSPIPSGIYEATAGNSVIPGDMGFAISATRHTQMHFGTTPSFYIYDYKNRQYVPYHSGSTIYDSHFKIKVPKR